jgi:4-hydroxy-3-methylbut-2-enyl diphosphate reductase
MEHLRERGCVVVDTTCGSVLTVWKNVHRYARDGFTAVIHGKHSHEETRATASQALTHLGGRYLIVRDRDEAELVCDFIRGRVSREALVARLAHAASPGFDPDRDLERIGLANQTTMLMSESIEVQELLRTAMRDRFGDSGLVERFRAFDTICSATQDRQDAIKRLLEEGGLDRMVVIGGYNSSNTQALARLCAGRVATFHIDGPGCLDGPRLRHRPLGAKQDAIAEDWLPAGAVTVGLTAGASTPNSVVAGVVERILTARGLTPEALGPASTR